MNSDFPSNKGLVVLQFASFRFAVTWVSLSALSIPGELCIRFRCLWSNSRVWEERWVSSHKVYYRVLATGGHHLTDTNAHDPIQELGDILPVLATRLLYPSLLNILNKAWGSAAVVRPWVRAKVWRSQLWFWDQLMSLALLFGLNSW